MEFCPKCNKKTPTIHNDFMVAFCYECNCRRGEKSDYTEVKRSFQCKHCGRITDESYIGQTSCLLCAIVRED